MFDNQDRNYLYISLILFSVVTILFFVHAYIGTFVLGFFVYYVSRPIYSAIKSVIDNKTISAALSLVVFSLPFVLLFSYTLAVSLRDFRKVTEEQEISFEELLELADVDIEIIDIVIEEFLFTEPVGVDNIMGIVLDSITLVGIGLFHLFLIFVFSFYALRDGPMLRKELEEIVPEEAVMELLYSIDTDLKILFFGNVLYACLAAIIGSATYLTLSFISPSVIEFPYPFLIGFLTGLTSIIPIVGIKVVYVPFGGWIASQSYLAGPETYWFPILFFIISFLIVDTIPDFVIRPYVSGDRLHLGFLIFAYALGPFVFGWYGLFLAPILLIVATNVKRIILPEVLGKDITPGKRVAVTSREENPKGVVDSVDRGDGNVSVRYSSSVENVSVEYEQIGIGDVEPVEEE